MNRPVKRRILNVAEESRPDRETKDKIRIQDRKPAGRKRVKERTEAKYVNWHAPFLWSQIEEAQETVKSWSPSELTDHICDYLHH